MWVLQEKQVQKGTDAAVMVTGDFILCQKKNVIIARCSSLHRASALLVSALTDKSRNRCLMRETPLQYFCEVISKSLNFVTNSESLCTPVIICLSFYRQLKNRFSWRLCVQRWEKDSVFRFWQRQVQDALLAPAGGSGLQQTSHPLWHT